MANLKTEVSNTTTELRNKLRERLKLQGTGSRWANPINAAGTTVTGLVSDLSQTFVEKTGGVTQGDINKLWRSKILLDRAGGPVSGRAIGLKLDYSPHGTTYNPNYDIYSSKVTEENQRLKEQKRSLIRSGNSRPNTDRDGEIYESLPIDTRYPILEVSRNRDERSEYHDQLANHTRNEVIIFNMMVNEGTYQYIILQNRPPELEFQGETSWASIKSFGRNTPMYHFTGAEDKIQLQVSWYCNDPQRPWEVVQKCRLLEAWSKANGYASGPPILQIDWGGSGLFSNAYFILHSATYKLCNFRDNYMDRRSKTPVKMDGKLYPMYATQELIFARVSGENLLHSSIYDANKLEGLSGVGYWNKSGDYDGNNKDSNSLWQPV